MHRSAWKGYSPNFACRILHRTRPEGREDGFRGPLSRVSEKLHVVVLDGYAQKRILRRSIGPGLKAKG